VSPKGGERVPVKGKNCAWQDEKNLNRLGAVGEALRLQFPQMCLQGSPGDKMRRWSLELVRGGE